jgi:putative nucleotide binding protein
MAETPSRPIKKDEWAIVLDFLSHGHYNMERSQPVAQVLGESFFSLLEVIVRDDVQLRVGERVYIGDGKRDAIKYIRGRIDMKDLTTSARDELNPTIEKIVSEKPNGFLGFFNKSGHISTRMHQLELLPGVGKRHLLSILEQRKEKPFESFEDIKKRVPLLPDPEKMVTRRIIDEISDKDKYRIFVPRMEKSERQMGRRF